MNIFKKFWQWVKGGKENKIASAVEEFQKPLNDSADQTLTKALETLNGLAIRLDKPIDISSFRAVQDYFAARPKQTQEKRKAEALAAGTEVGVLYRARNPNADEPMATAITSIYKKFREAVPMTPEETAEYWKDWDKQSELIDIVKTEVLRKPIKKKSKKKVKAKTKKSTHKPLRSKK